VNLSTSENTFVWRGDAVGRMPMRGTPLTQPSPSRYGWQMPLRIPGLLSFLSHAMAPQLALPVAPGPAASMWSSLGGS